MHDGEQGGERSSPARSCQVHPGFPLHYATSVRIELENTLSPETLGLIQSGMRRHTESCVPWDEYTDLIILARADEGEVIGAALGETGRGWLHLSIVWVDERFRGRQLGGQLVRAAESEALRRGCGAVYLNTFSYQAKPFYEKLGYAVFGTLEDYPQGHQLFFMSKRLSQVS